MKATLCISLLLLCGMAVAGVRAADTTGRDWALACTGCHGTDGRSEGAIPPIANMPKDKLVTLMKAFRDGSRPATVMHQHAKGLSDQQIIAIGNYFATRSPH